MSGNFETSWISHRSIIIHSNHIKALNTVLSNLPNKPNWNLHPVLNDINMNINATAA